MLWFFLLCILGPVTIGGAVRLGLLGHDRDHLGIFVGGVLLGAGGLALTIAMGTAGFHTGDHSGDGTSVGTVINVARTGFWWQVDEVYILHRGEMKAEEFGIDSSIVGQARRYAEQGTMVRIHYTSSYICGAWRVANCDVIDRIETDAAAEVRP